MTATPTPAVIEAWASLVRTEKALVDKVEERLKREGFPPLDWYHVLYEVDRTPHSLQSCSSAKSVSIASKSFINSYSSLQSACYDVFLFVRLLRRPVLGSGPVARSSADMVSM